MHPRLASRLVSGLTLVGALVWNPTGLCAEPIPERGGQGFFLSAGAGWGWFGTSDCSQCPETGGLSGYLEVGDSVSERVRLGLITTAWMKREDPSTTVADGNVSGAVTFFALPRGGLYARFGLGLAIYTIDGEVETGFGILAGGGYEFRPTRTLGIDPYLNWYHGAFDRFGTNVLQVGFALVAL